MIESVPQSQMCVQSQWACNFHKDPSSRSDESGIHKKIVQNEWVLVRRRRKKQPTTKRKAFFAKCEKKPKRRLFLQNGVSQNKRKEKRLFAKVLKKTKNKYG